MMIRSGIFDCSI